MERASSAAIEEHLNIMKIRQEHETYAYRSDIQTILFNLLSDCVKQAPPDPIKFMIDWLTALRDSDKGEKPEGDAKPEEEGS